MPITSPHFAPTFEIKQKGSVVVEQNSEGDLLARAANVLVCPIGFRDDKPEFGIPSLLFQTVPLDITSIQQEVARWAELDLTIAEHISALEVALVAEVSR